MAAPVKVGDGFERVVTLDEASIAAFAAACGDRNPLHQDRDAAARSRFGGIIASGPQTSSLLMGLCATWMTARGESVGLDFSFRFRKAVRAGETLHLAWTITRIEARPSLKGDVVALEGRAVDSAGDVTVESRGLALLLDAAP
jgi:acyl dehydratase